MRRKSKVVRNGLSGSYVLLVITITSALVVAVVAWVGLGAVRDLEIAADEGVAWNEIDRLVVDMSDELSTLVASANLAVQRDSPIELDAELHRARTLQSISELHTRLAELGYTGESRIRTPLSLIETSGLATIAQASRVPEAIDGQDEALLESSLLFMANGHQSFRRNIETLMDSLHDIRVVSRAQRVDRSETRIDLVRITVVPAIMLLAAMLFLSRRIKRRELSFLSDLRHEQNQLQAIVDCVPVGLTWKGLDSKVLGVNAPLAHRISETNTAPDETVDDQVVRNAPTWTAVAEMELASIADSMPRSEEHAVRLAGVDHLFKFSSSPLIQAGATVGVVTVSEDITEARQMERTLAASRRMESIGHLAAGVAHEINTPVQFVSDNTEFLSEAFGDLLVALDRLSVIARTGDETQVDSILEDADVDFLRLEVPGALEQSREGLSRVTEIVKAMKNFSHPGTELTDTDLNDLISATVSISRNEWKYIADMELDLDDRLPLVHCREGEIKQVILNIVVNAAHAVDEATFDGARGTIGIRTALDGDAAVIKIWDDGAGMDALVQERIFDRFFTTRAVGKGTGQGLSLAWETINKHGGTIDVTSSPGVGTSFTIRLPIARATTSAVDAATTNEAPTTDSLRPIGVQS